MANDISSSRPLPRPALPNARGAVRADAKPTVNVGVVVAEAGRLLQHSADVVDNVAATADWGGTLAEGAAKVLENQRFAKVALKTAGAALDKAAVLAEHVGTVTAGIQAGLTSDATTTTGKVVEGVAVAAGTKLMVNALSAAKGGNPVMLADMAMNYVGDKIIGEKANQAMGGYITGHAITTPAKIAVAYGEALFKGDFTDLDRFATDARDGKYGVVYQGALKLGDHLSQGIDSAVAFFKRR